MVNDRIRYLYLPVGGTGERLKADRPHLRYESKCFLEIGGTLLLTRILDAFIPHVEELVVVYCTEDQRARLERYFRDADLPHPVRLLRDPPDADPYSLVPTDGDVLAVMGDSYVPRETASVFLESVRRDPRLTFLRFLPERVNQPTAYYRQEGDRITDWSPSVREGYAYLEIGQLLYFPKECVGDLGVRCNRDQAIHVLRELIVTYGGANCLDLPCYNINTGTEYDRVLALASRRDRGGEEP